MVDDLRIRVRSVTLATYLIECGREATLAHDGVSPGTGQPLGTWDFKNDQGIRDSIELFEAGNAMVEPGAYYRAVKRVRSDMFKFLGIGNATSS